MQRAVHDLDARLHVGAVEAVLLRRGVVRLGQRARDVRGAPHHGPLGVQGAEALAALLAPIDAVAHAAGVADVCAHVRLGELAPPRASERVGLGARGALVVAPQP